MNQIEINYFVHKISNISRGSFLPCKFRLREGKSENLFNKLCPRTNLMALMYSKIGSTNTTAFSEIQKIGFLSINIDFWKLFRFRLILKFSKNYDLKKNQANFTFI